MYDPKHSPITRVDAIKEIDIPQLLAGGFVTRVEHLQSLTSTNDHARQFAAAADRDEIVLIVADEQTAGRGRGANRWWTGSGALAFSVLLDPALRNIERCHFYLISLAAAIAIVETARPLVPARQVGLHWPNDVFVDGRKLSGVLVEALADGRHIVGIGVNLNNSLASAPDELRAVATTLADLSGRRHDRSSVLAELLSGFDRLLRQLATDAAGVARRANALCLQKGRMITIESGNRVASGSCLGIADDGALQLETAAGREKFYSGVLRKHV
jgi:BirA family transcriptional regulator, biotin operon repressor / biotin---[acetyl-CoA-carboxylase] ligase